MHSVSYMAVFQGRKFGLRTKQVQNQPKREDDHIPNRNTSSNPYWCMVDHRAISCGPLVYTEVGKNSLAIHTARFLRWIPRTYWRVSLPNIERRYPPAQASSACHDRAFALTRDGVQNAAPLPGQSGPCGPGAHSRPRGARRPSCGSARPPGPRRARPLTQLLPPGAREDCGQRGPAASPIPLGPAAGGRGRGGGTVPARRQDGRAPAPQCSHLAGRAEWEAAAR